MEYGIIGTSVIHYVFALSTLFNKFTLNLNATTTQKKLEILYNMKLR